MNEFNRFQFSLERVNLRFIYCMLCRCKVGIHSNPVNARSLGAAYSVIFFTQSFHASTSIIMLGFLPTLNRMGKQEKMTR